MTTTADAPRRGPYRALRAALAPLRSRARALRVRAARNREFVLPGHFYSSVPHSAEVTRDHDRIYASDPLEIAGVDLRIEQQWTLATELVAMLPEMPFCDRPADGLRYGFDNPSFAVGDGIFLHLMIRRLRPRRIIEVGSGFSSACMLDTVDRCLAGDTACTFIDPEPALVHRLIGDIERSNVRCVGERVQDVPVGLFDSLAAGDLLFIDSSHVAKTGSDLNHLLFEVLPRLTIGVTVHFHDIFPAFEYPSSWLQEGRAWNECYVLRAFLQYNTSFQVALWPSLLWRVDPVRMGALAPGTGANPGGSLYLRRVAPPA